MDLANARIWLSGAIDDPASADGKNIAKFVAAFAAEVFRHGGTIVHGCQPQLTPVLEDAAKTYIAGRPLTANLALLVSQWYSKEPAKFGVKMDEWNEVCAERVRVTREAPAGAPNLPASLEVLRTQLCEQANVFVAVGGKWWETDIVNAGVPREIAMARDKQLPLFLLGGLGGATTGQLAASPELIRQCRNGLTESVNQTLAELADPMALVAKVVAAIARLPLQVRTAESGRPFRILCLDGGGICGTFTAAVLDQWEKTISHRPIADHFDLIVGTSTGGILAIGLGLGLTGGELLEFYAEHGPTIFPNRTGVRGMLHSVRHWFQSGYDQAVLKQCITTALTGKSQYLADSKSRLLIPSYDSVADGVLLFRTPHGPRHQNARWESVSSAQATAAAPTYFDPVTIGTYNAIDGGVWANSPTLVALAEAVHELGIDSRRIEMLSIGTTYGPALLGHPRAVDSKFIELMLSPFLRGPLGWPVRKLAGLLWRPQTLHGILGWLPNIAGFLMKTQTQASLHVIKGLLGPDRFLRVDEPTLNLDIADAGAIGLLTNLGRTAADQHRDYVEERFLNGIPADPWR